MKKIFLLITFLAFTLNSAFAQKVLIKQGDQYVGAKLALVGVAGASWGLVGNYEMGYQDNIGIGGAVGYSGYSQTADFYDISYSSILILATGTYHYDVLHNDKIDTWGALSLGYNVQSASAKYTGPTFNIPGWAAPSWSGSAGSGLMIGLSANGRYAITDKLSAAASLGFGVGLLQIGVDYKL